MTHYSHRPRKKNRGRYLQRSTIQIFARSRRRRCPAAAEGGGEGEQNGRNPQEPNVPSEVPTPAPAKKIQGDGDGPSPSKDSPPTVERALVEYAKHHGLEPSEVTEDMVAKSPEGLEGWACSGLNVNAHSPLGNSLYRAFKKDPKAAEAYRWLFDDLKKRFRQSWAMVRNFESVMHKRVHVIETVTTQEEIGTWKNELQLQQHFGGTDQPEAIRQATCYIRNCEQFKDRGGVVLHLCYF